MVMVNQLRTDALVEDLVLHSSWLYVIVLPSLNLRIQ